MKTRVLAPLLVLAAALPVAAWADDPPPAPAAVPEGLAPTRLTLRPAAAPVPALRYVLLPREGDRQPGNAVTIYYRAFSPEWYSSLQRDKMMEKIDQAARMPREQLQKELGWLRGSAMLKEVDRGARRSYCDWEMTERVRQEGVMLLLPDIQSMRTFGRLLAIRARLEIADGDYAAAVRTFQTGLQLGRDQGEGPTLIQGLVGVAVAMQVLPGIEELIQQPDSPNLYWALAHLPRPLVPFRRALEGERLFLEASVPPIRDIDKGPWTAAQLEEVRRLLGQLNGLAGGSPASLDSRLQAAALVAVAYPEARRALIARGRSPADVDALPTLQVVALHSLYEFTRLQDEMHKWYGLPYPQAKAGLDRIDRQVKTAVLSPGTRLLTVVLPAIGSVMQAEYRLTRRLEALRVVEALRLYAAAHGGQWPASLKEITEVPVPLDPLTGREFEYRVSGTKAVLTAPAPAGEQPHRNNSLAYELTLTK